MARGSGTRGVGTDELRWFGELLREYRRAAGLTQRLVANQAGLSTRGIQDLERGARRAPYLETARRLADALALGDDARTALLSSRPGGSAKLYPSETRRVSHRVEQPDTSRLHVNAQWLPAPLTSLVGRRREVLEIRKLLKTTRLLTLTGAGG